MNWVDRLTEQYEQGRRGLQHMKNELGNTLEDQQDKRQINSMINDMSFVLDWLKTGREPGKLRGVDKRAVYQRRVLQDMELFPSLDIEPSERELTDEEKRSIYEVLALFSARQRQCFILYEAYNRSLREIAMELNIKKATAQMHIDRARAKINKEITCHTKVI